jgi:hypothetical protein
MRKVGSAGERACASERHNNNNDDNNNNNNPLDDIYTYGVIGYSQIIPMYTWAGGGVIHTTCTTIMCEVPATADGTVPANRPGTVLLGNQQRTCLLIDIAIVDDPNVNRKETEKPGK